MSENAIFPGDKIASIEEYEAGHNAFDDGDMVRAATIGEKDIDKESRTVNVKHPKLLSIPKVGDIIIGTVAAGEVTSIGSDVKNIKVGDRVVSHGNMSCRVCKACTDGREFDCRKRTIWGFETGPLWGGYCEFTHLPEVNVVKIPEGVSYDEAAAASMTLLTSWHMLIGRAKIQPGQVVLIMGGSSGVGNFGIQIAKLFGCTVISTASPDKLDKLLGLGADYAVDHRKEDWHKVVRSIAKKIPKPMGDVPGVDVIFEHIGGTHWNKELTKLWWNYSNNRCNNRI